jgi:hypothetical protein
VLRRRCSLRSVTIWRFLDHRYVQRPLTVLGLLSGISVIAGVVAAAVVWAAELPLLLKLALVVGAMLLSLTGVDFILSRSKPDTPGVHPAADPPPPARTLEAPKPRDAVALASLALPTSPTGDVRKAAIEAFVGRENRIMSAKLATAKELAPLYHEGKRLRRLLQVAQVIGVAEMVNSNVQPQIDREEATRTWDTRVRDVLRAHGDTQLLGEWDAAPHLPSAHPTRSLIEPATTVSQLREFMAEKVPRLEAMIESLGTDSAGDK